VHLGNIAQGKKVEKHLCESCAESQKLVQHQELNLPAILQTLIGQHVGPEADELARLACPTCGIRYMEFRACGRLGCPHDYDVFRSGLNTLLQRIHRSGRHVGKSPRRGANPSKARSEILDLRRQLNAAVAAEAYEEAARLLELLREKEAADESG
jgi:protein arginine kinase activator